jgi:hypothetical protein
MHDHKFYIALDQGEQIDPDIMHILARGTELEKLEDGLQANKFLKRIRERVAHLTLKLVNKLYLHCEAGGTAVQTKKFGGVWKDKEVHFQAAVKEAASEGLGDDAQSDCDIQSRPRKRSRTWKLCDDHAHSTLADLPKPKRPRRSQKLRAKTPISLEFRNLRPKPTSRSNSKWNAIEMTTSSPGLACPVSSEAGGEAFAVPPVDHMVIFSPQVKNFEAR